MRGLHAYETGDGKVIFRRSGNRSELLHCRVIRTKAILSSEYDNGDSEVLISLIASGFERLRFDTWFADWIDKDNLTTSHRTSTITGRWVEVAVVDQAYELLIRTNRPTGQTLITSQRQDPHQGAQAIQPSEDPYNFPIAAVKIDDEWVEPTGLLDIAGDQRAVSLAHFDVQLGGSFRLELG